MLLARTGQRTFHQKSSSTFAGSQRLRKYHRLTFPNTAQPSDPHGLTGRLSNWVSSVQLGDIPSNVVERTKYLILDGIGCAILGAQLPWSKRATDICTSMEPGGHCSLIGWDKHVSPRTAALLNSTYIQGFELDDVHSETPWHANSVVLPALFSAIQYDSRRRGHKADVSGASLLLACIVGFETGGRVGRTLHGPEMLARGWHSGAVFGPAAAAASVSCLLRLSPKETEDAFGTACTQASGLMGAQDGADVKRMQHGFGASNGLQAALLAQSGYSGISKVFEKPYGGFIAAFNQGSQLGTFTKAQRLVQSLGSDWSALQKICVKPYASMLGTHAPIDCVRNIQSKHPSIVLHLRDIQSIHIIQSEAWYGHGGQDIERPINALAAQMSTKYCVAAQLVDSN
ncbi:hypothetical protein D0865_06919, partial [Hortaea werneckii]